MRATLAFGLNNYNFSIIFPTAEMQNVCGINPFAINFSLLYPLNTSENQRFSDIFREYRSGTLVENGQSICQRLKGSHLESNNFLGIVSKEKP